MAPCCTQIMYPDLKPYDALELSCFPWCFHREACKRWKVKRQLLPTLLFYNRRRRSPKGPATVFWTCQDGDSVARHRSGFSSLPGTALSRSPGERGSEQAGKGDPLASNQPLIFHQVSAARGGTFRKRPHGERGRQAKPCPKY